jgi:ribosomal protein S18 acetylase RimI-like enzyme
VIRPARPDDAPALRALDRAVWSWDHSPAPCPPEDAPFAVDGVLVAEEGGEPAGYVALGRPTRLESNRHVLSVRGLAVAPAFQGRGLGRALLRAAVEEARARGARRLTLRVLGTNVGGRALYESFGFVVEGVQRDEFLLDGRYVDDVLMALSLDRAGPEVEQPRARL